MTRFREPSSMFSIVNCPKCGQQVSIPAGLDPTLAVLCPLCQGEFTIGQALAPVPVIPPAVIPVAHVPDPQSAPVMAVPPTPAGVSAGGEAAAAATESPAATGVLPHVGEELGFADEPPSSADIAAAVVQTQSVVAEQPAVASPSPEEMLEDDGGVYRLAGEKPEPAQMAATDTPSGDYHFHATEEPFVDIFNDSPRPAAASSATAVDPESAHEEHAVMLGSLGFGSSTEGGAAAAPAPARGWQPRGKKTNPLRFGIGLVLSGLLGLLAAYLMFVVFTAACSSKRPQTQHPAAKTGTFRESEAPRYRARAVGTMGIGSR